jgi:imidazolonepropionase-like amidohydrolase
VVRTLIRNATIFDATGAKPSTGDLLVEGNRIAAVGAGAANAQADTVIDATGLFCMPGMTEGHAHLSFEGVTATENLITPTPEEQVFTAARGAKALIEMGFTSAYGASEAKLRLGVAVRNEVNAGRLPGPRIRAGGLELSVTGATRARSTIRASAPRRSSTASRRCAKPCASRSAKGSTTSSSTSRATLSTPRPPVHARR